MIKLGLVANVQKPGAPALVRELRRLSSESRAGFWLERKTAALVGEKGLSLPALLRRVDVLLAAGGDGSLLRLVHEIYPVRVPVLGINIGSLGFLTAMTRSELVQRMPMLLTGQQELRQSLRAALQLVVMRGGEKSRVPCALNDVVVSRGSGSRLVSTRVYLDGVLVNDYMSDGLIVSTPTGSTAYAMSAGGPIIDPEARAFSLQPICPHTLTNRALVFSQHSTLRVEIPPRSPSVQLQYDGCDLCQLQAGDWIEVRLAKEPVVLAFLAERDFFQILRQKLKWVGTSI